MSKNFKDMLEEHISYVHNDLNVVSNEFVKRSNLHDLDKIFNETQFNIYNEHFPILKTYKFGTKEYKDYEKKHFVEAHKLHAQNRHHYYSSYNDMTDINLFDLIEAIVDINCSVKQYNDKYDVKDVLESIKNKKVTDFDLNNIIENTINYINEKGE